MRTIVTAMAQAMLLLITAVTAVPAQEEGTSLVVLVDFTKSFLPLGRADSRALEVVGESVTKLAHATWEQPVRIFWTTLGRARVPHCPGSA